MQTKIYLVRHTETKGNIEKRLTGRQDYELTTKGDETVKKLTNYFQSKPIDVIYSSTSNRTFETVKEIAKYKGLEIKREEGLCEMYFGIYDGWKWEDVNKVNPLIHQKHVETNEIMCIPNQENTKNVADRMYNTILRIINKHLGKAILICSHGVAIEAFLRKITNEPFNIKREEYSQRNCSVNILNYDNITSKFELVVLNDINYLKQEREEE